MYRLFGRSILLSYNKVAVAALMLYLSILLYVCTQALATATLKSEERMDRAN